MELPTVSLIICSYNQAAYIKEAIEGALAQTYSPIEIIISDDCSSDATFEIIEDTVSRYSGPNTIVVNRNSQNLGLIEHVNKVFEMATGDLVVGSAGDDICLPDRIETLVKLYNQREGRPTLFHGNVLKIDPDGQDVGLLKASWGTGPVDLVDSAMKGSLYIGASSAFTRSLLNSFPPIRFKNAYEDLVWGFRAALIGAVVYVDGAFVKYRVGVGISWAASQKNSTTLYEFLEQKKAKRLVFIDVFSQRLLDLDHVTPSHNYKAIRNKILEKKLKNEIDYLLIESPLKALRHGWMHPLLVASRYYALQKVKVRFNRKRQS